MKIILVNGVARSGKDTLIQELSRNFSFENKYICESLSTIDEVKRLAYTMGWDGVKTEKSRNFLCQLKGIWSDFNNGPNDYVLKRILGKSTEEYLFPSQEYIYFIQCREPAGLQFFQETFEQRGIPCKSILVLRDDIKIPDNPSDQRVFEYEYDYYLRNKGTLEDYYGEILELKEELKKELNI